MEKILFLINEIEKEYYNEILETKIVLLIQEATSVLIRMRSCQNMDEADFYFNLLDQVYHIVAILIFKDEIELPDSLWKLYKDFDRIDDPWWKEYMFIKITKENYSLDGVAAMTELTYGKNIDTTNKD